MRILVIEDNTILLRNLVKFLTSRNIFAEWSVDWEEWFKKAISNYYDVIILDINLPKKDWINICRELREREKDVSIIILTSMGTKENIISWLDNWADDYLVKPFDYNELLSRINAIIRRKVKNKSNKIIYIWDIILDLEKHEVKKNLKIVKLSTLEFELFKYLIQNKGRALSRQEIYEKVWWEFQWDFMFSKTIDVYIWYLRKKLDKKLIETKKGFWFIIN